MHISIFKATMTRWMQDMLTRKDMSLWLQEMMTLSMLPVIGKININRCICGANFLCVNYIISGVELNNF